MSRPATDGFSSPEVVSSTESLLLNLEQPPVSSKSTGALQGPLHRVMTEGRHFDLSELSGPLEPDRRDGPEVTERGPERGVDEADSLSSHRQKSFPHVHHIFHAGHRHSRKRKQRTTHAHKHDERDAPQAAHSQPSSPIVSDNREIGYHAAGIAARLSPSIPETRVYSSEDDSNTQAECGASSAPRFRVEVEGDSRGIDADVGFTIGGRDLTGASRQQSVISRLSQDSDREGVPGSPGSLLLCTARASTASPVLFQIGAEASAADLRPSMDHLRPEAPSVVTSPSETRRRWSLSRQRGSEVQLHGAELRSSVEDEHLSRMDLDDLASHRFDDMKGLRRHKVARHARQPTSGALTSHVHMSSAPQTAETTKRRRKFDKSPHEAFVELEELHSGGTAWRETARWIKFEEDVEEAADRWGKPHVGALSFHALSDFREGLDKGALNFDLEESSLEMIAARISESMALNGQISETQVQAVTNALLLKHRHMSHRRSGLARTPSFANLTHLLNRHNHDGEDSATVLDTTASKPLMVSERLALVESGAADSGVQTKYSNGKVRFKVEGDNDSHHEHLGQHDIMRKIPKDAEATAVLTGAVDFLEAPAWCFVRLARGEYLDDLTEVPLPVRFIFVLLVPTASVLDYHEIGRCISTLMADKEFHEAVYGAESRGDLMQALYDFLDATLVLPPGNWDKKTLLPILDMKRRKQGTKRRRSKQDIIAPPDTFVRTRRPFGGLIRDARRCYANYFSELGAVLSLQCLSSIVFIYFACLAPAITFGGLLGEKVNNWMGASEMMLGCAICGVIFALFSGQPLMIVGSTGPIIIFEETLYSLCSAAGWDYLGIRLWVGVWLLLLLVVAVAVEAAAFAQYLTRFTEEVFSLIISFIFIFECFKKLYQVYSDHPLQASYSSAAEAPAVNQSNMSFPTTIWPINQTFNSSSVEWLSSVMPLLTPVPFDAQPNTALLSTILMLGTHLLAVVLRKFRNSFFFKRTIRRAIGDFGVPIAIISMVLLDLLFRDTYTQKLLVPSSVRPTRSERGWVISPLGVDRPVLWWQVAVAVAPAAMLFILLYMETLITGIIMNKPERKLRKGGGPHLDLLCVGVLAAVSGVFGLPFMCPAPVRCLSHFNSLSVYSTTHAPGEKPQLEFVREQRVTAFAVSILVGLSLLLGAALRHVPIAVLFGVFLYMGVTSLAGIQLVTRIKLLLVPQKHHPSVGYVRRVRPRRMHLYTLLQIICLAVLWAVKSSPAGLGFPVMLMLLVPLRRFFVPRIWNQQELVELDGDAAEEDEFDNTEEEPDFYDTVIPM